MNRLELDGRKILVIAYGHVADTMAAVPGLRSLRAAYPAATIHVLALDSAQPILGPCPYINRLITWRDFQHKGRRGARLEKLSSIAALGLRLRAARTVSLCLRRGKPTPRKRRGSAGIDPAKRGSGRGGVRAERAWPCLGIARQRLRRRLDASARLDAIRDERARIGV